jgi:hypothetical protein
MSVREWVVVIPAASENLKDVARELLGHADDPRDVRTQRGGTEFLVAPYVADRYTRPTRKRRSSRKISNESESEGS